MSTPAWKVYNPEGEYIAACRDVADAAYLVKAHGNGYSIRWRHRLIVWTEGQERQPAGMNLGFVIDTCRARAKVAMNRLARHHEEEAARMQESTV